MTVINSSWWNIPLVVEEDIIEEEGLSCYCHLGSQPFRFHHIDQLDRLNKKE